MWTNEGASIWLTADKSLIVPEGDPRAAFLLVAAGGQIPIEEAERYGLAGDLTAPPEDEKAKAAQPNKARPAPDNKSK